LTPWTTNIDAAGYSLLNVGTLAAANIQFGDNSLADMLASRLSTNWTGGPVAIDAANAQTNTFGGAVVTLGLRVQSGGATASGASSFASGYAGVEASGAASFASGASATKASGAYSFAAGGGTEASGESSTAQGELTVASGRSAHAVGSSSKATNDFTFVWSDGAAFGSTINQQFSVYASNGIRLLGGPITGNGSGLTNVNALTLGGVALAGLVQTNHTGTVTATAFVGNGSGLTGVPSDGVPQYATNTLYGPASRALTPPTTNGWTRQFDLGSGTAATNVASNPLLTVSIGSNYINVTGQYTNTTANSVAFFKGYTAPATQTVHFATEWQRAAGKSFPQLLRLFFREASSGKQATLTMYLAGNVTGIASSKFNADLSGADYGTYANSGPLPSWARIIDDGANRICQTSPDGIHWVTLHTVSRTDFITPDQMGWLVSFSGTTAGTVTTPTYSTTIWSLEGP